MNFTLRGACVTLHCQNSVSTPSGTPRAKKCDAFGTITCCLLSDLQTPQLSNPWSHCSLQLIMFLENANCHAACKQLPEHSSILTIQWKKTRTMKRVFRPLLELYQLRKLAFVKLWAPAPPKIAAVDIFLLSALQRRRGLLSCIRLGALSRVRALRWPQAQLSRSDGLRRPELTSGRCCE